MISKNTKQFVRFRFLNSLNEWLRLYGNRIIIESWQTTPMNDTGVNYTLLFHLAPFTADKIANSKDNPMNYAEQLNFLIDEANKLD